MSNKISISLLFVGLFKIISCRGINSDSNGDHDYPDNTNSNIESIPLMHILNEDNNYNQFGSNTNDSVSKNESEQSFRNFTPVYDNMNQNYDKNMDFFLRGDKKLISYNSLVESNQLTKYHLDLNIVSIFIENDKRQKKKNENFYKSKKESKVNSKVDDEKTNLYDESNFKNININSPKPNIKAKCTSTILKYNKNNAPKQEQYQINFNNLYNPKSSSQNIKQTIQINKNNTNKFLYVNDKDQEKNIEFVYKINLNFPQLASFKTYPYHKMDFNLRLHSYIRFIQDCNRKATKYILNLKTDKNFINQLQLLKYLNGLDLSKDQIYLQLFKFSFQNNEIRNFLLITKSVNAQKNMYVDIVFNIKINELKPKELVEYNINIENEFYKKPVYNHNAIFKFDKSFASSNYKKSLIEKLALKTLTNFHTYQNIFFYLDRIKNQIMFTTLNFDSNNSEAYLFNIYQEDFDNYIIKNSWRWNIKNFYKLFRLITYTSVAFQFKIEGGFLIFPLTRVYNGKTISNFQRFPIPYKFQPEQQIESTINNYDQIIAKNNKNVLKFGQVKDILLKLCNESHFNISDKKILMEILLDYKKKSNIHFELSDMNMEITLKKLIYQDKVFFLRKFKNSNNIDINYFNKKKFDIQGCSKSILNNIFLLKKTKQISLNEKKKAIETLLSLKITNNLIDKYYLLFFYSSACIIEDKDFARFYNMYFQKNHIK